MILIQEIETVWSKNDRSSENSKARKKVPHAVELRLPLPTDDKLFVERRRYEFEEGVFLQSKSDPGDYETQERFSSGSASRFAPIEIRPGETAESIKVKLLWDLSSGSPTRPSRHLITLQTGEWFRFVYNARFGGRNQWSYRETTLNVGYFEKVNAKVFLNSAPTKVIEDLQKL